MTSVTAFAAPVSDGTMFSAAARASRGSFAAVSSVRCELVYECTVVRKPFLIPNSSLSTFATGASPLVVHEAFEMMWCFSGSNSFSLTPRTTVLSSFFAGAEMITYFAPASRCAFAFVASVKKPVDSMTTSTPRSFHGSFAGSFSARTLIRRPSMTSASAVAETSPL